MQVKEISPLISTLILAIQGASFWMLIVVFLQFRERRSLGLTSPRRVESVGWTGFEVSLIFASLAFAYFQVILFGKWMVRLGWVGKAHEGGYSIVSLAIVQAFVLTAVYITLKKRRLTVSQAFGLGASPARKVLLYALVSVLAVLIPVEIAAGLTRLTYHLLHLPWNEQPVIEFVLHLPFAWQKILMCALAVAGAPLMEETLFRGILYPFLKTKLGLMPAAALSALLFAIFHFHPPSIPPLFVLGVAFALLYERSGSLATCILMHGVFNGANLVLLFLTRKP